jgi:hypothetical protein
MKKLLFVLLTIIPFILQAQDATITLLPGGEGKTVAFWGATTNAITDQSAATYTFALNTPFTLDAYIQVTGTKVTGYSKFIVQAQQSLDNVTYYAITNMPNDTCKTGVTCSKFFKSAVLGAKITGRYLKITVTGIDSTQHNHLSGVLRVVRKFDNL